MKNKIKKVSKTSVLFYVLAVIFLLMTLFFAKLSHDYVTSTIENSGSITLETTVGIYLSNCGSYLAFSFIFYGIGLILNKFSFMNNTLADCMVEAIEDTEEETEDDDYFSIHEKKDSEETATETK